MRDAIQKQRRERTLAAIIFVILLLVAGAIEARRVLAEHARAAQVPAQTATHP